MVGRLGIVLLYAFREAISKVHPEKSLIGRPTILMYSIILQQALRCHGEFVVDLSLDLSQ